MISVACSQCGKVHNVRDELAGKKGRCRCGATIVIPAAPPPEPEFEAPEPTPRVQEPGREKLSVITPAVQHKTVSALKRLWQRRAVRMTAVVLVIVLVGGIVFRTQTGDINDDLSAYVGQRADEGFDRAVRGADLLGQQAEADFAEAERLRARAARLRAEEAVVEQPTMQVVRVTKSDAIESNTFISMILDRHPDLGPAITKGGWDLEPKLALLVSQGKLPPSQVNYIRRFSQEIQSLPDY